MLKQNLIAEIGDNEIRYGIYEFDKKSNYKLLNKKISQNLKIKKGKTFDYEYTSKKINEDIKNLEKESDKIFTDISIVVNEPETFSTNLSGFKKLNGAKVEKRDLDYILNEAKNSIQKNQENHSILHILNSKFILDKEKKNKIPLHIHGNDLSLHMTFISLPKNNLKNIKTLFDNSDLTINRVISKPFACGINLLNKNKGAKNFALINLDKEICSISLYEDSSLVFLKNFPFGTNSIYNDIIQLCSLSEKEARNIIKYFNFESKNEIDNKYVTKDLFTDSEFKKLSIKHINDIIKARISEILDYIYNKNKNLDYLSDKIFRVHLFFEDKDILENLSKLFKESLNIDQTKTQIELLHLNDFSALSGAAELIFKGWDKEVIPLSNKKKSVISSFFGRFFT